MFRDGLSLVSRYRFSQRVPFFRTLMPVRDAAGSQMFIFLQPCWCAEPVRAAVSCPLPLPSRTAASESSGVRRRPGEVEKRNLSPAFLLFWFPGPPTQPLPTGKPRVLLIVQRVSWPHSREGGASGGVPAKPNHRQGPGPGTHWDEAIRIRSLTATRIQE